MNKKHCISISLLTCLFLTFQSYANIKDKRFSQAQTIYKLFCSNIITKKNIIDKNWSNIKRTKNLYIYENKTI